MSDAERLLTEASPLPWAIQHDVFIDALAEWGPTPVLTESRPLAPADADLIVYAVNRLPAYEAAVEALDLVLDELIAGDHRTRKVAYEKGIMALARLRETVPA